MKSNLTFTLILMTVLVMSCRKKDIQPVVSLVGNTEQTISLGQNYVEQGATAMDNKDGDISEDIKITGSVNKNLVGEYRIFYDVEDSEGNKSATATRYVKVVNNADFMIGTYEATPTCTGTATVGMYHTSITTSMQNNNQIFIRRVLFTFEDEPVVGYMDGTTLTIPAQIIGGNTVSGSGVLVGNDFLLSVDISGGGSYNCSIYHVKQ